jgi:hypothetical protein
MASRHNSWLSDLGKTTTVYHRRGASFARGANYKGYRVWEDENGWHTSLDPGSWFDSQRDAKNLIDSWEKDRKNPRKCACPDCKTRKNVLPLSSLASGAGSASGILGPSEKWLKQHGVMQKNVTDRALRYRAQKAIPQGEKRCNLCGLPRSVEVGHVNGNESDTEPNNLFWTCRPCNVLAGNAMRRAGVGRLTHQYNPEGGAKSVGQWLTAVTSMKGENGAMSVSDAVAMIRATSPAKRSEYASEIWATRKARGNPMKYGDVKIRWEKYHPDVAKAEGRRGHYVARDSEGGLVAQSEHRSDGWTDAADLANVKRIVRNPEEEEEKVKTHGGGKASGAGAGGAGGGAGAGSQGGESHTDVRSPTSTSTDAKTTGNITVTGGAGRGATTTVKIVMPGGLPSDVEEGEGELPERSNPETESADSYEKFHGFRPKERITVKKKIRYHENLWACGDLEKLDVISPDGVQVMIDGFKGAMLSANEANTQLYIEGGDQSVNLADFGLGEPYHDKEDLGEIKKLYYSTNKTHLGDQGGEAIYHHTLGEERTKRDYLFGKLKGRKVPRPRLVYDVMNQALEIIGGEYVIEPEGIRN